jgi:hypothetical protein
MEYDDNLKLLGELLIELEGKSKILDPQTNLMFKLNNYFFPKNLEYGKSCGGCRSRVYKRLTNFYNDIKNNSTD